MIKPESAKIETILNSSVRFFVPKYQRSYAWGKEEAVEFIEDLKNHAGSSDGRLFLGTLIFDNSEEKQQVLKIVDGQQRLTTILLLLVACRELAKKINSVKIATLIQEKITFSDSTTAKTIGHRLSASESIKEIFEFICDEKWDGTFPSKINKRPMKRQINKVRPVYDFFVSEIQKFDANDLSNFLKAIYETYIIRIDIQDALEAFNIFERTNARGIDLEATDLLKNYLFSQQVDDLETIWPQVIDNSDGTALRMLKYFHVSKKGYIVKSNLYKSLREYGKKIGANDFVKELDEFSRFYATIRSADKAGVKNYFDFIDCQVIAQDSDKYEKIYYSFEGLRLFKIFQVYPLIYSAIQCFRAWGGKEKSRSKALVNLLELLEKYHFVNTAICERMGNEVERLYADFSVKFSESKNFEKTANDLAVELKKKMASKQEFISRFAEISYSPESIPLISYIFDRINNCEVPMGSRIQIFNPDQKVLRKNHNIEHFEPQESKKKPNIDEEMIEAIDNIGNLFAISFRTNSRLGSLSPAKKMEKLRGPLLSEVQNLKYIRDFIDKYTSKVLNWDKNLINARAKELAEEAYSRIWNFG